VQNKEVADRMGVNRRRVVPPRGMTVVTGVLLVVLICLVVYPTVTLLTGAFKDGSPFSSTSNWSLGGFATAYGSPGSGELILNSVVLALVTAVFGTAIGFLFAWVATRTTVPLRRLLTPVMVVTVALPSLFNAMSWSVLGNENAGLINQAWRALTGAPDALINIYTWPGLLLVSLIKPVSVAYLLLLGPARGLSRSIEEASVLAGTGRIRTMFRVTAPVLAPTILAVAVINLIIGLEAFDVPALIAVPAGIPLLSTEIYRQISENVVPDYPASSALALGICVIVLILVAIRWRLVGTRSYATITGKAREHRPWALGGWSWIFTAAIVVYAVLALVLPLAQLLLGSFQPIFGLLGELGTLNYDAVLGDDEIIAAVIRSLLVGVGGGFLAMVFTLAVGYIVARAGARPSARILDMATWLPAALPGIVLGLALSWAYLALPFLRPLYGTPVMLVLALMVAGLPIAARASEGGLVQISPELEEASRTSGSNRIGTIARIVLPLIAPSFLAGWLLTALYVAGRLDVPILLSTRSNRLAIVSVYELYSNGRPGEAAAVFCLLLIGFVVIAAVMAALAFGLRRVVARAAAADAGGRGSGGDDTRSIATARSTYALDATESHG
jgi:iron(III) transport system permease protein